VARPGSEAIELSNGALATSEGAGCVIGGDTRAHHLFDPRSGRSANRWARVSVAHRSAAVADALSTALYAASPGEISAVLEKFAGVQVWATDRFGLDRHFRSPHLT
jgi:thiamine biosynthesis lipoprotein